MTNYYEIPADKIGLVLWHLNAYGWQFNELGRGVPIEKWYGQATSRDWDGHKCVFQIEITDKLVSITSDLLMKANNQTNIIHTFQMFKKTVGLN